MSSPIVRPTCLWFIPFTFRVHVVSEVHGLPHELQILELGSSRLLVMENLQTLTKISNKEVP